MRRAFAACALLSTLLLAGACALWIRGRRGTEDQFGAVWKADRFTLRSEPGRLTLYGPPPLPPPVGSAWVRRPVLKAGEPLPSPEAFALKIRNDDARLAVKELGRSGAYGAYVLAVNDRSRPYTQLARCGGDAFLFRPEAVAPALLRALDDPSRVVAAHTLLCAHFPAKRQTMPYRATPAEDDPDTFHCDVRGLPVTLRLIGETIPGVDAPFELCDNAFDMTALPAIREQWHRRLDVPVRSATHAALAPMFAALPAAWVAAALARVRRTRVRRRAHLCPACGYDVRATPDRCPECGAPSLAPA